MASKSTGPGDLVPKNLQALRKAIEQSVVSHAGKLRETVDELVSGGTLTRAEADRLLGRLVETSKGYSTALLQAVDAVATETRKTLGAGVAPVMSTAGRVAESVKHATELVKPGAKAKATPPRPDASGEPIPDYDSLTVAQIKPRLTGLSTAELRKVREHEAAGKSRKTVLAEVDRLLKG